MAKPYSAKRTKRPIKPRAQKPGKAAKPRARRSIWQAQEARANLSAVIDAAMAGRAQTITRDGEAAVVVVSAHEYNLLVRLTRSFDELFRNSPLAELFGASGIPEFRHKELLRNVFI